MIFTFIWIMVNTLNKTIAHQGAFLSLHISDETPCDTQSICVPSAPERFCLSSKFFPRQKYLLLIASVLDICILLFQVQHVGSTCNGLFHLDWLLNDETLDLLPTLFLPLSSCHDIWFEVNASLASFSLFLPQSKAGVFLLDVQPMILDVTLA